MNRSTRSYALKDGKANPSNGVSPSRSTGEPSGAMTVPVAAHQSVVSLHPFASRAGTIALFESGSDWGRKCRDASVWSAGLIVCCISRLSCDQESVPDEVVEVLCLPSAASSLSRLRRPTETVSSKGSPKGSRRRTISPLREDVEHSLAVRITAVWHRHLCRARALRHLLFHRRCECEICWRRVRLKDADLANAVAFRIGLKSITLWSTPKAKDEREG